MYKTHYRSAAKHTQAQKKNWLPENRATQKLLYRKKKMTKPKWTLKWMFVSVLIIKISAISANDNTHYLPPLECYDPYGRPQVSKLQ